MPILKAGLGGGQETEVIGGWKWTLVQGLMLEHCIPEIQSCDSIHM